VLPEQVWYSAAWSRATQASFFKAIEAVLDKARTAAQGSRRRSSNPHSSTSSNSRRASSMTGLLELDPAVERLLLHWRGREVALAVSREAWLDSMLNSNSSIGNFKQKCDRLAYCRYILCGELGLGKVASTTMFALPEEYGHRAADENFLKV
jgi:hypothetical protein